MKRDSLVALLLTSTLLSGSQLCAQQPRQQPDDVTLTTDVFEITFSAAGGVPVRWTVNDPTSAGPGTEYLDPDCVSRSSFRPFTVVLDSEDATTVPQADTRIYEVSRSDQPDRQEVTFTSPVTDGLQIAKTYSLTPGSHVLQLRIALSNSGTAALTLRNGESGPGITLGPGLGYSPGRRPELFEEGLMPPAVLAFAKTTDGVQTLYPPTADAPETELEAEIAWGGLESQYYALTLVPDGGGTPPIERARVQLEAPEKVAGLIDGPDREFYSCVTLFHRQVSLDPGASTTLAYAIYAGPKDTAQLEATGLGIEEIQFHHLWDWLAGLCRALGFIIASLYGVLGSWGLAIVVFAVLFRLITLPLSIYGAKNQMLMKAKMAKLKPLVAELKQQHKNADKRNEAILALYKQHGINPFSHFKGCLPLMIQLPILIALFQLLLFSFELRGQSFLWIDDLTLTDRLFGLGFTIPWLGSYFNLLPFVMLTAMVIVGRMMNSAGRAGGGSNAALYGVPIAMTLLFYPFPAGCMLFWATGNVLQIAEQKLTNSIVAKAG